MSVTVDLPEASANKLKAALGDKYAKWVNSTTSAGGKASM